MARRAKALQSAERKGVNYTATIAVAILDANIASDTGGDMQLSGVKASLDPQKSSKISGKLLTATSDVNPTAIVKGVPAGLMTIVESGALKHVVGAKNKYGQSIGRGYGISEGRVQRTLRSRRGGVTTFKDRTTKIGQRTLMPTGLTGSGQPPVAWGPFMTGGSRGKKPFSRMYKSVAPRAASIIEREALKAVFT